MLSVFVNLLSNLLTRLVHNTLGISKSFCLDTQFSFLTKTGSRITFPRSLVHQKEALNTKLTCDHINVTPVPSWDRNVAVLFRRNENGMKWNGMKIVLDLMGFQPVLRTPVNYTIDTSNTLHTVSIIIRPSQPVRIHGSEWWIAGCWQSVKLSR